ncbi:MAG: B12-binding domain-containing radical SAM protein [Lachnospiraceae bacterium]|nr:B12-binding domain-containing radical SAM protein [Lachnospiraceae bacterium]
MKVLLAALNAKYVHSNLAVYDIEAYIRKEMSYEKDIEIVVKEYTINHNLERIRMSLYEENADFIAFSCYIWNIAEVLVISKEIKKVMPQLSIWLGGPEVSYDSEKLLEEHEYIDGIICGEGEVTTYDLIKMYSKAANECRAYADILGIVYRGDNGKIITNPERPLMSLDEVLFIYEDMSRFENKILYYESSRGCPFCCSYCLSSIDKSVRFRSMELVEKELSFFMAHKVRQVKFIDRTFNCDRLRARKIWQYLLDNDNGITNFHFEIAGDLIDEEDIKIFSSMRPGLIQLEIGLQTTNPDTIKEIHRSMDIAKLKKNMLAIRRFGNIHQHLDLIAGLPYEDYNSFIRSFNDAYDMRPNQLQLGFLKVLKGSYMQEQVKNYELLYCDEQPYEVLSTKWISYSDILRLKRVEEMVEVYYNSNQFENVIAYVSSFFESPFDMYDSLGAYNEHNILEGIGIRREARYILLKAFFEEHLRSEKREDIDECLKIFDSLLTFDYYLRENAKSRPVWRKESLIDKKDYNGFFIAGGNDELSFDEESYDSKAAMRSMHIEPIVAKSIKWIEYKETHKTTEELYYVVFDYSKRNPLTGDASYNLITHL